MATEEWRPIEGYEGRYEVSSLGRVRNADGHIRKPSNKQKGGYKLMSLRLRGGQPRTYSLHKLVAHAFLGPRPEGLQCAHLNGDPADNRAENLAYVTIKENMAHKRLHGTQQIGERHPLAVLTDDIVVELRRRAAAGENSVKIANDIGVWPSSVRAAVKGRTWSHIPGANPDAFSRRRCSGS